MNVTRSKGPTCGVSGGKPVAVKVKKQLSNGLALLFFACQIPNSSDLYTRKRKINSPILIPKTAAMRDRVV